MRSVSVVVLLPCSDVGTCFSKGDEQRLVEAFVPEAAIESFYDADLHWFAGRDGKGTRLIFGQVSIHEPHVDHGLLDQLKIAHRWYALLASGKHPSISSLARSERVDPSEVSRTITLAFLAPAIVRMILRGTQPASLTLDRLRRARPLPACWKEQRQLLIG